MEMMGTKQILRCNLCHKEIEGITDMFKCKFCDEIHCSSHRLPEEHQCDGLRQYKNNIEFHWKSQFKDMAERKTFKEQDLSNFSSAYDDDLNYYNGFFDKLKYRLTSFFRWVIK